MSKIEDFLSAEQEHIIIKAIKIAEKNTSGEIRVHIEKTASKPPLEKALEVFYSLEMDKTEQRNGVLLYIAVESKQFAILGDEGINAKVSEDFWVLEKELILTHFKKADYTKGIELAILKVGEKLKEFFPYQDDDTNELSDEISRS